MACYERVSAAEKRPGRRRGGELHIGHGNTLFAKQNSTFFLDQTFQELGGFCVDNRERPMLASRPLLVFSRFSSGSASLWPFLPSAWVSGRTRFCNVLSLSFPNDLGRRGSLGSESESGGRCRWRVVLHHTDRPPDRGFLKDRRATRREWARVPLWHCRRILMRIAGRIFSSRKQMKGEKTP